MDRIGCFYTDRGPRGKVGKSGSAVPRSRSAKAGSSGKDGSATFHDLNNSVRASYSTITFIQMMLSSAENDFLNQRRELAGTKLLLLHGIVEAQGDLATETVDSLIPGARSQPTALRATILQRLRVLMAQLRQGVDYYGHYPNFVPLTSLKIYDETIDALLPLATDIENAHHEFLTDTEDGNLQVLAIKKAISSLNLKRNQLTSQKQQLKIEVARTRDQVKQLLDEQLAFEFKLRNGKSSFIKAVEAQSACGIEDVLRAAGAVATITSGVGAVIGGISALKTAKDMIDKSESFEDWKETGEYISKKGENVAKGFNSIADGYSTIKERLSSNQDSAKLITTESEFEEQLKPYLALPEARDYLQLIKAFLAIVKLRNNKILEVDTKYTRLLETDSELDALETEVASTNSRLGEVFNPVLSEHVIFFERAVARIRADILRAIVMAHHALAYWSLQDDLVPEDLHTNSLDYLKSYHASFKQRVLSAIENRNMAPLEMTTPPLEFSRTLHPEEFSAFDETGRFTFEIKHTHPVFLFSARVLVNKATIRFDTENEMTTSTWCFLQHHGDPTLVDSFGNTHRFTHRQRESRNILEPGQKISSFALGGSDAYAFLSPLATWTLIAEFAGNDGHPVTGNAEKERRKNLISFAISFEGLADSRYGNSNPQPEYVRSRRDTAGGGGSY